MSFCYDSDASLPSSPSSSPSFGPIDSSPLSSPNLNPLSSPPPSPGLVHPFAASAKATRRPKLYEKREQRRLAELDAFDHEFDASCTRLDDDLDDFHLNPIEKSSMTDSCSESGDTEFDENERWAKKISEAIDECNGIIDLSHTAGSPKSRLTAIPPSIGDLANFVALPDASRFVNPNQSVEFLAPKRTMLRAATAPARSSFHSVGSGLAKASSFAYAATIRRPGAIHLFLANNQIQYMPPELFWVQGLVVLSLRGNCLTSIPPQIATLRNLEQLNISNNQIPYLPAEILGMTLQSLTLDMNPWLHPPTDVPRDPHTTSPIVSPTLTHYVIPSLKEFIHRVLFSPTEESGTEVALESMGGSTALPDHYPAHLWDELHRCAAQIIPKRDIDMHPSPSKRTRRQKSYDHEFSFLSRAAEKRRVDNSAVCFGVGECPNSSHETKRIFVRPAEERHTWERMIAGHHMPFPGVPVLWRGCSRGCLDFLQPIPIDDKDKRAGLVEKEEVGGDDSVQMVDLESLDGDDSEFE
ncbi:hypothetical protein QCA50_013678 [Cerrena zonata]|uniref:Uncharacterized protein n=1 Tax=Cerrena zonata TaxID=2478898 RepID=A0AAW0FQ59_9APHY